ncbi:MAG: glycine betaine ABC transporter substrate-binding protein, partial [Lapillicoccus sp.]
MPTLTSFLRPRAALVAVAVGALGLSACSSSNSGNAFAGATSTPAGGGAATSLVVGAQGFTEAKIMQQMYVLLLTDAGYTVTTKTAERAVLTQALTSGEVSVIPDYLGSTLNFVANQVNKTTGKTYSS